MTPSNPRRRGRAKPPARHRPSPASPGDHQSAFDFRGSPARGRQKARRRARIRPRLRERSPTPFAYPPSLTETTLHISWMSSRAHSTSVVRRLGGGKSRVAGARIRPRLRERSPTPFAYPLSRTETTFHIPWMRSRLRRSPRARRACETPGGPGTRWPRRRPRQQKPRGWHRWRTAGSSGARRPESLRHKRRPDP